MSATKKKAAPAPEKNGFEEYTAKATASVQENMEKFSTAAAEMGDLTRENFEAVVESATTYARGVEGNRHRTGEFHPRSHGKRR